MTESIQLKPRVKAIPTELESSREIEVSSVTYASDGLLICVTAGKAEADVEFQTSSGFRVLDELDLTEFWKICSLKDGWIFEVEEGGWKDLELRRPHFVSGRLYPLYEFLVIGQDTCVSVLSSESPTVSVRRGASV